MRNWIVTTEKQTTEYYKGHLIHACPGLHEQMMVIVSRYIPSTCSIIDIGAGAFSRRLKDHGFDMPGIDVDDAKWKTKDIPFLSVGLNHGISLDEKFEAACCIEVIEHLENPWQIMRDIHSIIRADEFLFLSTPNVTFFLSRIFLLRRGRLHQFFESDLSYGHINPLTFLEIKNIVTNTDWDLPEILPGGYLPISDFSSLKRRNLILNLLRGISYISSKEYKKGWNLIFVLRRS